MMKYIIVLGDGMADEPVGGLGGQTPLEYGKTPTMDRLAQVSEIGMVHTIPKGMKPGSDTANLSVLGYNPEVYYTGRSPLEALSIGVDMDDDDIAIRANLVTLSEEAGDYENRTITDHSSGEISTQDASVLLEAVARELGNDCFRFYAGTSYRHLLIWKGGSVVDLSAPHDHLGCVIKDFLPENKMLYEMMKKSYDILVSHPINVKRREMGLNPANSLWFWGAGTRPALTSFEEKTGKKGVMISTVDLLKGIAVGAQMENMSVEGANGGLHTNYRGKAMAAVHALLEEGNDFAYIHVEAPDEMGHQGSVENKIKSIEYLDDQVIKTVVEAMDGSGEPYRLLVLPDHPTPVRLRTHTAAPVPYMLYDSREAFDRGISDRLRYYNEKEGEASGICIANGYELIDHLFSR